MSTRKNLQSLGGGGMHRVPDTGREARARCGGRPRQLPQRRRRSCCRSCRPRPCSRRSGPRRGPAPVDRTSRSRSRWSSKTLNLLSSSTTCVASFRCCSAWSLMALRLASRSTLRSSTGTFSRARAAASPSTSASRTSCSVHITPSILSFTFTLQYIISTLLSLSTRQMTQKTEANRPHNSWVRMDPTTLHFFAMNNSFLILPLGGRWNWTAHCPSHCFRNRGGRFFSRRHGHRPTGCHGRYGRG
jgi:hypothetical protein